MMKYCSHYRCEHESNRLHTVLGNFCGGLAVTNSFTTGWNQFCNFKTMSVSGNKIK